MEENEALLEDDNNRRLKSTLKTYSYEKNNFCDSPNSSGSEESVSWWAEESHSSCNTSCSGPDSVYSADWKYEIDANGELFYIESENFEELRNDDLKNQSSQFFKEDALIRKESNSRKGKLKNWIKRKHAKRRRPKLPAESGESLPNPVSVQKKTKGIEPFECPGNDADDANAAPRSAIATSATFDRKSKEIPVRLNGLLKGGDTIEKVFGLKTFYSSELEKFFITGFTGEGPLKSIKDVNPGDVLLCINREKLSCQNIHRLLEALKFPVEVTLTIEKNIKLKSGSEKKKLQSALVQRLLKKSDDIEKALKNQAVGVVFIPLKSELANQKELIYSFPRESIIARSLGSFVTLFHLSPELALKNECYSSSVYFKSRELAHVCYIPEKDHLLLVAIPGNRYTKHEASYIVTDLVRCLLFSHRTLNRCFKCNNNSDLDHFFSVFFLRILTSGFSAKATRGLLLEKIGTISSEAKTMPAAEFEDLLQYAECLPLPKEIQIQIDDSLSELEANYDSEEDEDFDIDENDGSDDYEYEDDGNSDDDFIIEDEGSKKTKMDRGFVVIGSCMYHKGYLLASHFSKEDLSSVHSFFRQNGLVQLFRTEPVKSLVIWREVHPKWVVEGNLNDELSSPESSFKRWFLLVIGHEYDAIVFILELHGYSGKFKKHLNSMIGFIEDGQEKLRRLKKWGISQFATHWLTDKTQSKTITVDEYFSFKKNTKKMETAVVDMIKSADEMNKSLSSESPSFIELKQAAVENGFVSLKNRKISYAENSEDSTSQAPSNQSEISDENAPILGRRAERNSILTEQLASDESENSESDWESFQDFAQQDYATGIFSDPKILKNQLSSRSRLTTGGENSLFHFVHFNECEGILIAPTLNETSTKMKEIVENFRRGAQLIHSLLDNNVRFKKSNEDGSKSYINKSLIAVKEHGLLFSGTVSDAESITKKPCSIHYWVIGRLFYTPGRREVYVCHSDDAPQNLVEIGFRLGLSMAE